MYLLTPTLIKEYCELESDSKELLMMAYDKYGYSARTFDTKFKYIVPIDTFLHCIFGIINV